jgi:hypothetical protein
MPTFRRVPGAKYPKFLEERLAEPNPDGSKKIMVMLDRVEVPEHIARTCRTPEQQAQAGGMAANASLNNFFRCIDIVMTDAKQRQSVGAVRMPRVGLRCEGRGGCYDLFFFPSSREVFAAHAEDPNFVCSFVLPDVPTGRASGSVAVRDCTGMPDQQRRTAAAADGSMCPQC